MDKIILLKHFGLFESIIDQMYAKNCQMVIQQVSEYS